MWNQILLVFFFVCEGAHKTQIEAFHEGVCSSVRIVPYFEGRVTFLLIFSSDDPSCVRNSLSLTPPSLRRRPFETADIQLNWPWRALSHQSCGTEAHATRWVALTAV